MNKTQFTRDEQNKTLTIERVFNAPQKKVWRALTDPVLLDQWWAPKPWKAETKSFDFRPGGHWHYAMNGPNGEQHWGWMDFLSIDPETSYSASDAFVDEAGNKTPDMPATTHILTTLEAQGDSTKVIVLNTFASLDDLQKIIEMGVEQGFAMAQDQLEEILAKAA